MAITCYWCHCWPSSCHHLGYVLLPTRAIFDLHRHHFSHHVERMSQSGRLAWPVASEHWQKPAVRTKDWQGPSRRIGKSQSASCLPPFHRGCFLLVPLFTTILSALLPPWMFLARAIVDMLPRLPLPPRMLLVRAIVVPHLVTLVAATVDVCCSCHC